MTALMIPVGSIPVHEPPSGAGPLVWLEPILKAEEPVRNSIHRHSYHELFIFTAGEGTHMIDLEHVRFQAPCIHFVAPGQVHKLDRERGSAGMVIMFTSGITSFFDGRVRQLLRPGTVPIALDPTQEQLQESMELAGQISKELALMDDGSSAILENLLTTLLLICWRWSRKEAATDLGAVLDVVGLFLEKVDKEFKEKKQVTQYAADLGLSAGHLNELVKKRAGRTASAIIQERSVLEAKRLLLHSHLSVKEVGFSLGMEDPAYFTRMFRKATGTAPQEFRQLIREKYKH